MNPKGTKKSPRARQLAIEALVQIEKGGAYSNLLLNQLFQKNRKLDPRDRGLITELVYGTLQQQRLIDFYLQPFLKQDIDKLEHWVKQLLRISLYQFMFLDRVPEHAIVHEAVEISKHLGHKGITGMVNGVLRNFLRSPRVSLETIKNPVEQLAVRTSHPTWLVQRWVEQLGMDTATKVCEENNRSPKLTIRVNLLKSTRSEIKDQLEQQGYMVKETTHSPIGLIVESNKEHVGTLTNSSLFLEGYITIQDESSMLIAPLLDPQPGMKVLDACAAPGGKTTHLAEMMKNEGEILALDLHPHKVKLIQASARRLEIDIIHTKALDARKLPDLYMENGIVQPSFDRILLDAPCSGFGVIRRKPDIKWKKKEEDIEQISQIQYKLLSQVSKLLKKDGQLVYSTCTIELAENELLIQRFLTEHTEYVRDDHSTQQILPQHFGSDGFFMTKLQKK